MAFPRPSTPAKRDGHSLDHGTTEQIRFKAVERVLVGERVTEVARTVRFAHPVVTCFVLRTRKEGDEALHAIVASKRSAVLDDAQIELIRALVVQIDPNFRDSTLKPRT